MNLKPCPFCGSEKLISALGIVVCLECISNSKQEIWNNRPCEREVAKRIVRMIANESAKWMRLRNENEQSYAYRSYCMTTEFLIRLSKQAAKEGGLVK